jgi:CheY-like chemotaxis protein
LIVEDEASLRGMAEKILKRVGYTIITAQDGPEALNLWPKIRSQVDLLFTDMMMPGGITGRELAERLVRDRPELPVIYSTGYSVDLANPEMALVEGVNLLVKPYDATALIRAIRNALDKKPAPA